MARKHGSHNELNILINLVDVEAQGEMDEMELVKKDDSTNGHSVKDNGGVDNPTYATND